MVYLAVSPDVLSWSSLFADIATIIGAISVILVLCALIKNRLSAMSFKIKLTCTARYGDDYNKTRQFFRLTADMYNFTDKEFFITKLYIKIADNNYIFHTMQDNGKDVLPYELKNLPMRSHEAKTIYGVILVPQGLSIPKKCIAIIETTERRLVIRVRLSVSGYFAK